MSMLRKSKLPDPRSNAGSRPLPAEPPAGGSGDAPPPLPSRIGHGKPQPSSGHGSIKLPPAPAPVPVRVESPGSSDEEGQTYEEPDMPPAPPQSRHHHPPEPPQARQPPPPEPPHEPEVYDDLEDVATEHEMEDPETYDECDLKPVPKQQQPQQQQEAYEEEQLYEAEPPSDDLPPPVEDTDCLYEFMPEEAVPPPLPAAPAVPTSRPNIPLPPAPIAPGLPARPPPSKPVNKDLDPDPVPDLPPGRPPQSQPNAKAMNSNKKMSGEGPQMLGISLEQIGLKRANLKKVSSEESKAPDALEAAPAEPAKQSAVDTNSVTARINLFKNAEKEDTDSSDVNIQREITHARSSLRPQSKSSHNSPSMAPQAHIHIPSDTSHLSIHERIALMNGQSRVGGGSSHNGQLKPNPNIASDSLAKHVSPFKPQMPPKPVQHTSDNRSLPAVSHQSVAPDHVESWTGVDQRQKQPMPEMMKPAEVKSPVMSPPPVFKQPTPEPQSDFFESDDIYDDGSSYVPDALSREEWYHGELDRADTASKLNSIGHDGTFLVRKSKQGGDSQPYTLVVLYQGHVYNLKMRCRKDGQVALGEAKSEELTFKDVPSLIQHHRSHDVMLINVKEKIQYKTMLKKHPISMNG